MVTQRYILRLKGVIKISLSIFFRSIALWRKISKERRQLMTVVIKILSKSFSSTVSRKKVNIKSLRKTKNPAKLMSKINFNIKSYQGKISSPMTFFTTKCSEKALLDKCFWSRRKTTLQENSTQWKYCQKTRSPPKTFNDTHLHNVTSCQSSTIPSWPSFSSPSKTPANSF